MRIPLFSLIATVVFVLAAVVLLLFAEPGRETLFFAILASTLPTLVAAFSAERTNRDVRNGVITDKARQGAEQALDNKGVTEVVELTHRGQSSTLAIQALTRLLETEATQTEFRKEDPHG